MFNVTLHPEESFFALNHFKNKRNESLEPQMVFESKFNLIDMERELQRVKTHSFENAQQAQSYLDLVTRKGLLPLTPDLWFYIILQNDQLSLRDVEALCNVNDDFRALCHEREIWRKVFEKQVPEKDREIIIGAYRLLTDEPAPLKYQWLLFLWRTYKHPSVSEDRDGTKFTWRFSKFSPSGDRVYQVLISHIIYDIGNYANIHCTLFAKNSYTAKSVETEAEWSIFEEIIFFLEKDGNRMNSAKFTDHQFSVWGPLDPLKMMPEKVYLKVLLIILRAGYTFKKEKEAGIRAQICQRIGCDAVAKKKCALCDTIYCSDDCGKLDWVTHDMTHF